MSEVDELPDEHSEGLLADGAEGLHVLCVFENDRHVVDDKVDDKLDRSDDQQVRVIGLFGRVRQVPYLPNGVQRRGDSK